MSNVILALARHWNGRWPRPLPSFKDNRWTTGLAIEKNCLKSQITNHSRLIQTTHSFFYLVNRPALVFTKHHITKMARNPIMGLMYVRCFRPFCTNLIIIHEILIAHPRHHLLLFVTSVGLYFSSVWHG